MTDGGRYLTIDELAERLNLPRSWIEQRVASRDPKFPHSAFGKHIRFSPDHVAAIDANHERVQTS